MTLDTIMTILGSNILTSVASYIAGKKRSNAETDNLILANLERAIDVYSKIIDNLKIEITELHSKIDEMEKKIDELHDENKKLKKLLNNAAAN